MLSLDPILTSPNPASAKTARAEGESKDETLDFGTAEFAELLAQALGKAEPANDTPDDQDPTAAAGAAAVGIQVAEILGEPATQPSIEVAVTTAAISTAEHVASIPQVSQAATTQSAGDPHTLDALPSGTTGNRAASGEDANPTATVLAAEMESSPRELEPFPVGADGNPSHKLDATRRRGPTASGDIAQAIAHRDPHAPDDKANGPGLLPDVPIRQIVMAAPGVEAVTTAESVPVNASRRSEEMGDGPLAVEKAAGVEMHVRHRFETVSPSHSHRVEEHASANITRMVQEIRDRVESTELRQPTEIHIRLEPPELGRVRILLRMDGDQLHGRVLFQHDTARQMFESYLPSLRRQLGDAGIQLGNFDVADHGSRRESPRAPWQQEPAVRWRLPEVVGAAEISWTTAVNRATGLDVWA